MKKLISLLFVSLVCISLSAKGVDDEQGKNRVAINGMLTSQDSYQLEASYHYMLFKYVGIGCALGYWRNYCEDGFASGNDWWLSSDDRNPENLYLRPSLVLKSPAVKIKEIRLGLFAEPGVMLNIPYKRVCLDLTSDIRFTESKYISTNKGQWCAADVKLGVYLNDGNFGISAGYMMSNLDIYSQMKHLSYEGQSFATFYPKRSLMQGAYLSCSYYF